MDKYEEAFQKFIYATAEYADHLLEKEEKTKQEDDFLQAFEEFGDIITSPEFQRRMMFKKK